jgi:hypothetical protein
MRNDYVLVVAGNGWANEVVVNVRIVVNRSADARHGCMALRSKMRPGAIASKQRSSK